MNPRFCYRAVSALAAWLLAAAGMRAGAQAPGTRDTSFFAGASSDDKASALAVQWDGKILAGSGLTLVNDQPRNRIGRLLPDGTLESLATFDPAGALTPFAVHCVALQRDGRMVIGGHFIVARRLANGALDTSFSPAVTVPDGTNNDFVNCLAIQPDGKILVGGNFTEIGGVARNGIARLMPDGAVDLSFNPGTGIAGNFAQVRCMALQDDGRIIIGGEFSSVNGEPRTHIARLHPDGSLEGTATFAVSVAGAFSVSGLFCVLVQPDGKICIGGGISAVNANQRRFFARLFPSGLVDALPPAAAIPGTNEPVESMALQADGKILLSGSFTTFYGHDRRNIARLNADLSLDPGFVLGPGLSAGGRVLTQQADGKVLVVGNIVPAVGGGIKSPLHRVFNDAAIQSLESPSTNRVLWTRGGSAPEVHAVTFEKSSDGGLTWKDIGSGHRVADGWEWMGPVLRSRIMVRARGRTMGGLMSGSSGIVESVASFDRGPGTPHISVEQPAGTPVVSGAVWDFGAVTFGTRAVRSFTVRNTGDGDLSGLSVTFEGPDATLFSVSGAASAVVEPGESAVFTVDFAAAAQGPRTATLRIAGAGADGNPLTVTLTANVTGAATEIAVEHPAGVNFPDGGAVDYGSVPTDSSVSRTWIIKNTGAENLVGLTISKTGADAAMFSVTATPAAPVSPGGSTSLTVNFAPSSAGNKSAVLHLLCNDADESPFDIVLTGRGLVPAPMGAPDLTFGGTGAVIDTDAGDANRSAGYSVALQTDGKIVVAGYSRSATAHRHFTLWRFHRDGRPDTGFNGTGRMTPDLGDSPEHAARSVTIQSDGRIVAAGDAYGGHFVVVRCLPDGSPDPAFNGTGTVMTDIAAGTTAQCLSVAVQSDGRIVAGGMATDAGNVSQHFALARYLPDGSLDATFGSGGRSRIVIGEGSVCSAVAVLSDGRILAGGTSGFNADTAFTLVRFTAGGQLDFGFGSGGVALTDFGGEASAQAMAVQSDGKILLGGGAMRTPPPGQNAVPEFAVARYLSNGTPDFTFGTAGQATFLPTGAYSEGLALALQADGKILLAGNTTADGGGVVRFLPDGSPDSTYNSQAASTWPLLHTAALAVQSDGKLLLTGITPDSQMALVRLIGSTFPVPEILLEDYAGSWIPSSGTSGLGSVLTGSGRNLTFTVRNAGYADLTGISFTLYGVDAGMFSVTPPPPAVVAPGGAASFTVRFVPGSQGPKTAALHIASNDGDGSPFTIHLTGAGRAAIASDAWRMTHFGTFENSGPSGDFSDPDGDGLVNLVEFVTGANPLAPSTAGQLVKNGTTVEWTFTRRKDAMEEFNILTEFSESPAGPWDTGPASETILTDEGGLQTVRITMGEGAPGRLFVRLRVTGK